jgi:hypothetical protein
MLLLLQKNGKHDVLIPMELVHSTMGGLQDIELRVEAQLTEYLYGETVMGFSHTRIISSLLNLYFLGASPMVFIPGTLFEGHVRQIIRADINFQCLDKRHIL